MTTTAPPFAHDTRVARPMGRFGYATTFTEAERAYLRAQPLGRLATIGRDGAPQISPVVFSVSGDTIEIGGPALRRSQMYRNLQADARIAFVVDDVPVADADAPAGPAGQRGRGVEIRGRAELFAMAEPRMDGSSDDRIRLHPHRILARNIDDQA
jgi:pyridoxamine 5'-phosphate oxidase family protein